MNTSPLRLRIPVLLLGALLIVTTPCLSDERHDTEQVQSPVSSSQMPPQAPSLLQVTGTTNRFEVSANHADVLSVLRAIFEQSHRQFAADSSVTGDVTLVLNGQTFDVVLASVCRQTFLHYNIDRNGIYQFQRDDQALLAAFARIRVLNAAIADQLRRLGFTVPTPSQGGQMGERGFGGGGLGGFSGGGPGASQSNPSGTENNRLLDKSTSPDAVASKQAPQSDAHTTVPRRLSSSGTSNNDNAQIAGPQGPQGYARSMGGIGQQGAMGRSQNGAIANQPRESLTPYEQLLRDNGLVGIHAKRDQPVPIADVLKQFSRQSNVPILVDPGLQRGEMLRFFGNIVQPLPEALNYLLPVAHLEWRYVGNTIFVTEAPDFGIFYGTSNVPRAVYPPDQSKTQQPPTNQQSGAPRPAKPPAKPDGQ